MSPEKRSVWGETTQTRDLALEGNRDRQPGSVLPDILCILAEPPQKANWTNPQTGKAMENLNCWLVELE